MSFDVYLTYPPCSECGRASNLGGSFNLTHNVNGIVDACLVAGGATKAKTGDSCYAERSWGRLEGWSGADVLPIAQRALEESYRQERLAEFKAMEPDNGWGSLESVQRCLRELVALCAENPKALVEVSG